jgi:2-oxoglutarate ferredoxin oxidoreductase subunit beta
MTTLAPVHPVDDLLRQDRMPHIWCQGCGLGIALNSFLAAVKELDHPEEKISVVSGIGCSGRVAGYVRLDSFHTTHGRAIPFATGLHLANPELKVVVFSGDGDLVAIGGNHLIHAARRNLDLTVICVNNMIYGMTGGQVAPTTPMESRSSTSPKGNIEPPFNLPSLAAACGAVYVARWTVVHFRQLRRAIAEAMNKRGLSFVEIISPCPTLYGRINRLGAGIDMMKFLRKNSTIRNGSDPRETDIERDGTVIVGKFLDIERPTFYDRVMAQGAKAGQEKPGAGKKG